MTPALGSHLRMHSPHAIPLVLAVPLQRALAGPAAAAEDHVHRRACTSGRDRAGKQDIWAAGVC